MYLWACVCTYGSVYVPMGVYVCTHLNPDSLISSLLAETRERHVAAINSQQFCLEMTSTLHLSCLPARGQIQQNNSQRQMTNTTWKTRVGRYSTRRLIQCDQMAFIDFFICPFITMKNCQIVCKIYSSRLYSLPNTR